LTDINGQEDDMNRARLRGLGASALVTLVTACDGQAPSAAPPPPPVAVQLLSVDPAGVQAQHQDDFAGPAERVPPPEAPLMRAADKARMSREKGTTVLPRAAPPPNPSAARKQQRFLQGWVEEEARLTGLSPEEREARRAALKAQIIFGE
jgi:hypothetical protein